MKWESLEDKIKAALLGHRSEVDTDAIWAAIEPGVDAINRRKKRRGFIWFFLGGLLLAGVAGGYFYQKTNLSKHGKIAKTQTSTLQGQSFELAKSGNDEPNTTSTETQPLKVTTEKTALGSELMQTKSVGNRNRKQVAHPATQHAINTGGTVAGNVVTGSTAETHATEKLSTDLVHAQIRIPPLTTSIAETPAVYQSQIPAHLPSRPFATLDKMDNVSPSVKAANLLATETPLRLTKPFSWSIGLQGSLSFVERKLEARDSLSSDLLALRENTERELEAYQLGMRFTAHHRSGFGLTSGLNFTQINEQFRFNSATTSVDSVYGVKYLVVSLNNDTIPIYGEIPLETKTTYQKTYYNKYRMIDVPVLAGYRYRGRNCSLSAQAGVFVNLSLATQGQIMQSDTEFMAIDTAGIFRPNVGVSYFLGLSAGYLINENLEVHISPFMRHYPKSFTQDSYALRQRYNLVGVDIGLRFHF